MKVCKSCESVVPAHLEACPHCRTSAMTAVRPAFAALLLGLSACSGDDTNDQALYGVAVVDADEDGYFEGEDCDDDDPAVHPDAEEVPENGIDDDCDGTIDQ